jgi:hypothetical protein
MAAKVTWHGDEINARINAEFRRRVRACTILVWNHWKVSISGEGTGRSIRTVRIRSGRIVRKKQLVYNFSPSSPGEPPHVQTGRLRASAAWEIDGLIGRVGSNLKYLVWLELGTTHMAARPSLRRALRECTPAIRAILEAPMKL